MFATRLIPKGSCITKYDGEYRIGDPGNFYSLHDERDPRVDYCVEFVSESEENCYVVGLHKPEVSSG